MGMHSLQLCATHVELSFRNAQLAKQHAPAAKLDATAKPGEKLGGTLRRTGSKLGRTTRRKRTTSRCCLNTHDPSMLRKRAYERHMPQQSSMLCIYLMCLAIALNAILLHTVVFCDCEACHRPVSASVKQAVAVSMLTHLLSCLSD